MEGRAAARHGIRCFSLYRVIFLPPGLSCFRCSLKANIHSDGVYVYIESGQRAPYLQHLARPHHAGRRTGYGELYTIFRALYLKHLARPHHTGAAYGVEDTADCTHRSLPRTTLYTTLHYITLHYSVYTALLYSVAALHYSVHYPALRCTLPSTVDDAYSC